MNNELENCVETARKIAFSTMTVGDINQMNNIKNLLDAVKQVEDVETYNVEAEKEEDGRTL